MGKFEKIKWHLVLHLKIFRQMATHASLAENYYHVSLHFSQQLSFEPYLIFPCHAHKRGKIIHCAVVFKYLCLV